MDFNPTTILLIDDNDKDRAYYAHRLSISIPDCMVLEAKDGRSGLALYHSNTIDCLVMELALRDMSGFEVLFEVVPSALCPSVAVVILTRLSYPGIGNLARASGAYAVLVKRLTVGDELAPMVQKAIAAVGPTRKDKP